MAREIRRFTVTVPAGTAIATPQVTALTMPSRVVRELEVVVPPGPRGQVGFALGSTGVAVIPVNAGAWLVTDNETIRWPLEGFWDSGSWQMRAYNTGRYPHTLEVRFLVDLVGSPNNVSQPIDPGLLATVAGTAAPIGQSVTDGGSFPLPAGGGVDLTGAGGVISAPPAPVVAPPLPPPVALPPPPALPPPAGIPGPMAPSPVGVPAGNTSAVGDWYQELLGRPADPSGAAYWASQYRGNGGPLDFPTLVTRFVASPETQADAARAPNAFVAGLYHVLLGRDGAAGEIGYWAGRIRGPVSPGGDLAAVDVARAIAASPEAVADFAGIAITVTA
jgi:hypothetical protein